MQRRTSFTDAIVLRSVDYGETDRIVSLLTRDFGKVSALARGARKSSRRFGGCLDALSVIRAELSFGQGDLGRFVQAELVESFSNLLRSFEKIQMVGHALRTVRLATPSHEPDPRLFNVVVEWMRALDEHEGASESLSIVFHIRLLTLLGFAPRLDGCGSCGLVASEGQAALFDPRSGALRCRACGGGPFLLSGATRARLQCAMGSSWSQWGAGWSERETQEGLRALSAFMEHRLERSLTVTNSTARNPASPS